MPYFRRPTKAPRARARSGWRQGPEPAAHPAFAIRRLISPGCTTSLRTARRPHNRPAAEPPSAQAAWDSRQVLPTRLLPLRRRPSMTAGSPQLVTGFGRGKVAVKRPARVPGELDGPASLVVGNVPYGKERGPHRTSPPVREVDSTVRRGPGRRTCSLPDRRFGAS